MRYLLILLLLLPVRADAIILVGFGGGTCTIGAGDNWINVETGDFWLLGDGPEGDHYQNVANSGSKQICKLEIMLYDTDSTTDSLVAEIWNTDKTTQYGSDSSSTGAVTDQTGPGTLYTVTFSEPYPTPPGDFRIYLVPSDYTMNVNSSATEDKYFGGTSYNMVSNGVARSADMHMKIWYIQ